MKKITIGIIIGIIISCTVGVLASTIVPAKIVTYQDKTVNTALDELYNSVNLLKTRGDAESSQILTGKKVIVKGTEITGTMANRGNLNWTPSTGTSYTVPAGYYSGGILNSSGAYNTGYSAGVSAADNRANANSTNYKTGYNAGYSAGSAAKSIKLLEAGTIIMPEGDWNITGNLNINSILSSYGITSYYVFAQPYYLEPRGATADQPRNMSVSVSVSGGVVTIVHGAGGRDGRNSYVKTGYKIYIVYC